jgi:hypothetical protein
MWNPFRSEGDAFRFAIAAAAVAALSLALGLYVSAALGWAVFAVVAIAGLTVAARRKPERAQRLKEAAVAPHEGGPPAHRILVVANESLAGTLLRREIMRRVELWPELHVVAPVECSRSHYWANDYDGEVKEARERLEATLAWARASGFEASGDVTDPSEHPLQSIEQALRRFGADEVIVATHPPERESWLEEGLLDKLLEELDVPVTHVTVDYEHGRVELEAAEDLRKA